VRIFSTNSRPACGRPPAAAVLGRNTTPTAVDAVDPSMMH
jgi:hypothetical protein